MGSLLRFLASLSVSVTLAGLSQAQAATLPAPGQPTHTPVPGSFEIIGSSYVSAQQLFLGTPDKVYFIDKVEGNPTMINGHPAWASEWTLGSNTQRAMDAVTNSFCAGGNVLGNGTWLNVGGNQAVTYGGEAAPDQVGNGGPYHDPDGRNSIRLLTPCEDGSCDWFLSPFQTLQRWYPTLETLENGSIIILGGCKNGGYVNDAGQDNPSYEFFPPQGPAIPSPILNRTLPVNLFPLTWLLPSGKLLIQSNWATVTLDYKTNIETPLDDIPDAVRVYPASAGNLMLPLTPANNWTATILFCGGSDVPTNRWTAPDFIKPTFPASTSCVKLTPDVSSSYTQDDPLPEARVMASFIALPDGTVLNLNGAGLGTAGYAYGINDTHGIAIGNSYGDKPVLTPAIYNPAAPAGSKWSRNGYSASTVPRMYHSTATLLPDGSVFVSGSNPNSDYTVGPDVVYPTEYRTEILYPLYYNQRRPQPKGLLAQYTYGGPYFNVQLNSDDFFGNVQNVQNTMVVIIRMGFSTHAMNMGQRFVQLNSTYTAYRQNNTATLHVSQLPPNPAILAPGPAYIFVVVNGVPSIGLPIMVGSGQLGTQNILPVADLIPSTLVEQTTNVHSPTTKGSGAFVSSSSILAWLFAAGLFFVLAS